MIHIPPYTGLGEDEGFLDISRLAGTACIKGKVSDIWEEKSRLGGLGEKNQTEIG
jgi:hypothetical protein